MSTKYLLCKKLQVKDYVHDNILIFFKFYIICNLFENLVIPFKL